MTQDDTLRLVLAVKSVVEGTDFDRRRDIDSLRRGHSMNLPLDTAHASRGRPASRVHQTYNRLAASSGGQGETLGENGPLVSEIMCIRLNGYGTSRCLGEKEHDAFFHTEDRTKVRRGAAQFCVRSRSAAIERSLERLSEYSVPNTESSF